MKDNGTMDPIQLKYERLVRVYLNERNKKRSARLEGIAFGFRLCLETLGKQEIVFDAETNILAELDQGARSLFQRADAVRMRLKLEKIQ
jgi:hypothetical protein